MYALTNWISSGEYVRSWILAFLPLKCAVKVKFSIVAFLEVFHNKEVRLVPFQMAEFVFAEDEAVAG